MFNRIGSTNSRHFAQERFRGFQIGSVEAFVGHIQQIQQVLDNDAEFVTAPNMLAELREDNIQLAARMRETYALCEGLGDVATTSLIETWIDPAESRIWWLFEVSWQAREFG